MSRTRSSPRKFSEKIALLNKREADTTAEFEKIIQEVEATTRAPTSPRYHNHNNSPTPTNNFNWIEDSQTSANYTDDSTTYYDSYPHTTNIEQTHQQFHHPHSDQQHHHHHHQHHHVELPTSHQHDHYSQQATTSTHVGLVPNIEISHTDEDNSSYYHQQQQVNSVNIVPNDRSNSMSAARSLPDIANLRVNSPSGSLLSSSSYNGDQRLRSNTISNNHSIVYNTIVQSNDSTQDAEYYNPQQQLQQPNPCFQQQQQLPPVILMDNPQSSSPETYNEYYHSPQHSSMVRASSSNAVMGNWSNNSNTLYTPRMNHMFSRSSDNCCGSDLENPELNNLM